MTQMVNYASMIQKAMYAIMSKIVMDANMTQKVGYRSMIPKCNRSNMLTYKKGEA